MLKNIEVGKRSLHVLLIPFDIIYCSVAIFRIPITVQKLSHCQKLGGPPYIQSVSNGQVNPYGGDSGPYLEQKILMHFFRIRLRFRVTRP